MKNVPFNIPAHPPARAVAEEGFITKDEVARRLKLTPRSVEKMQAKGAIPFYKVGYTVRYLWSDIQHHMRTRFGRHTPRQ